MKFAVLAVCLAATLAAGCRREEAAPMYEPMKLGGTTQDSTSRWTNFSVRRVGRKRKRFRPTLVLRGLI
jgi:nitrous oxide reductase accessory protein NosL